VLRGRTGGRGKEKQEAAILILPWIRIAKSKMNAEEMEVCMLPTLPTHCW
jgi:hypothetical protein